MTYRVRYTRGAKNDIERFYHFLLEYDIKVARRALKEIEKYGSGIRRMGSKRNGYWEILEKSK